MEGLTLKSHTLDSHRTSAGGRTAGQLVHPPSLGFLISKIQLVLPAQMVVEGVTKCLKQ